MATLNTGRAAAVSARSAMIAVAWGSMLLLAFVSIGWSLWTGDSQPAWINWMIGSVVLMLVAVTFSWPGLRPLRGFLLALLALIVGDALRLLLVENGSYIAWVQIAPWGLALVADRALRWLPTLLMLLTVLASGYRREHMLLAKGKLRAPVHANRLFKRPRPWIVEAGEFMIYFSLGIILFNWLLLHPDLSRFAQSLINLPFVLLGAALNSSSEEVMFRSVLMSRLALALGPQQALWLQATFFGLVHWSGNPSGPLGVLLATFLGWFLGKSVLETRGLAIAVTCHFILNTIQYLMFALVAA